MNAEIKKTWLTALRSGDYKQAHGVLSKMNGEASFCCMGILAEVNWPNNWIDETDFDRKRRALDVGSLGAPRDDDDIAQGEIPEFLLAGMGLDFEIQQKLIRLNDGRRWTCSAEADDLHTRRSEIDTDYCAGEEPQNFRVIADYIEENV